MKITKTVDYSFRSLKIGGGGFVTGFVFHKTFPDILYARTDVGGIYRYEFDKKQWKSLGHFINDTQHSLTCPISVAVDEQNPDMLFAVSGDCGRTDRWRGKSWLMVSKDRGETFSLKKTPFQSNGNFPARSTAERLAFHKDRLYFGSQGEGLFVSENYGDSWERLDFCEENLTFVTFVNDTMIVGATGETKAVGNNRSHTLFVSYDFGKSFGKLEIPRPLDDERCDFNGFVPVGISSDSESVFVTFSHSHKNIFGGWNSFACDNGGGFDGRLYRYDFTGGRLEFSKDLTPALAEFSDENKKRRLPFGLGGVSAFENILAVCSLGGRGERIFISHNRGESFEAITDRDFHRYEINDSYLKPEYNGGRVPLHWMSNLQINPHNPDFAVFNTGTGIFSVKNLSKGFENVRISTLNEGVEETVHLNIYGVPSGRNKVIDIVGDLGGFAFKELDKECENSFADENNHRYITCVNADFMWENPDIFVATARGNWTGHTKGGVILTTDGGESFTHIGYPTGITDDLDKLIKDIKTPNRNSGWCAISADGEIVLWTVAKKHMSLSCFGAVRYDVCEKSFEKVKITDIKGADISHSDRKIKFFSDRKSPDRFYGFGESGSVFVSLDKGKSFEEIRVDGLPDYDMSGIDGFKRCEIRFLPEKAGVCYAALWNEGLWRIEFDGLSAAAWKITGDTDFVKTVGFGKGKDENPAIYVSGKLCGKWGFFRSFDNGKSWEKLGTDAQMFGNITSIDGDMTTLGRFYFATGGFGAFVGNARSLQQQDSAQLHN